MISCHNEKNIVACNTRCCRRESGEWW